MPIPFVAAMPLFMKFLVTAAIAVPLMLVVLLVTLVVIYEWRRIKRSRRNLPREGMDPPGFEVLASEKPREPPVSAPPAAAPPKQEKGSG